MLSSAGYLQHGGPGRRVQTEGGGGREARVHLRGRLHLHQGQRVARRGGVLFQE